MLAIESHYNDKYVKIRTTHHVQDAVRNARGYAKEVKSYYLISDDTRDFLLRALKKKLLREGTSRTS